MKSLAILVAGLFLFGANAKAAPASEILRAEALLHYEDGAAFQEALKRSAAQVFPSLAERVAFHYLASTDEFIEQTKGLSAVQKARLGRLDDNECTCPAFEDLARRSKGLCGVLLEIAESLKLECHWVASRDEATKILTDPSGSCLEAIADNYFDPEKVESAEDFSEGELLEALAGKDSENPLIRDYSDKVLLRMEFVFSQDIFSGSESYSDPDRTTRKTDRLNEWAKDVKRKALAMYFVDRLSRSEQRLLDRIEKRMSPSLQEMSFQAVLTQNGPWSPRSYILAERMWESKDPGARRRVSESALGSYFLARSKGIKRLGVIQEARDPCILKEEVKRRLGKAAEGPGPSSDDDGQRWAKEWPKTVSLDCGELTGEGGKDIVASYRQDSLYYCSQKQMSVWRGRDGTRIFEKSISSSGWAKVLIVDGKAFLHADEDLVGSKLDDASADEELLYRWDGTKFEIVYRAGEGDRMVCGSGPTGVWTMHELMTLDGQAVRVSRIADGAFRDSFIGSDEYERGDVRVQVEPLHWDDQKKRMTLGPAKSYYQEEILGFPFRSTQSYNP